jgi:PAS domain S-box-containing protein
VASQAFDAAPGTGSVRHTFGRERIFPGDGEMSRRVREFDWSSSSLGAIEDWPTSLQTIVRVMLDSRYAMWLGWGPNLTFFYNDAYATMTLGPKHPWALGKPAREVWSEIWNDIGPRAASVVRTGKATWDEGLLLILERQGFPEETYHTFSYSPVPDGEGGVGGMLCVVTEDTERSIGERRLQTLRELAARTNDLGKSAEAACATAGQILANNAHDVPMALIYLLDDRGERAILAAHAGVDANTRMSPRTVDIGAADCAWPFAKVIAEKRPVEVNDLVGKFGDSPKGPWPEPSSRAIVIPLAKSGQSQLAGFFVVAASSRRPFVESYRAFFDLLASQIATVVANAQVYEQEKRRAESLAALDRAKTAFFSNISHEFRTPLTLMLTPVEELLARSHTDLSPATKRELEVVHRNGLRLLRLVNSLLDFSRIEAGRVRAVFQPTNLAAFTVELSSVFRAATERAGLRLTVNCPKISEPVYVDRDMWEKIVLNLLSNAFKFTFDGEIAVELKTRNNTAELTISDTGIGVAAEELPRLFERFHRIENARGRTHEGSGIGLALVQELVKLHGGSVHAESKLGAGTTFIVSIPLGCNHISPDMIHESRQMTAVGARPFVEEALRWFPDDNELEVESLANAFSVYETLPVAVAGLNGDDGRPRVLIVDDNADMRHYLVRLLSERYAVEAATDGEAALSAVGRQLPDLILTDVMMPRLDGFGLLSAIRADPRTAGLPIIMLSARAGEESRVEGMEAGADDYLVKPFSSKEVVARVEAHLNMARVRSEAATALRNQAERLRIVQDQAPIGICEVDMTGRFLRVNDRFCDITGYPREELLRTSFQNISHPDDIEIDSENYILLQKTDASSYRLEKRYIHKEGHAVWIELYGFVARDPNGAPQFGVALVLDISERKRAEEHQQLLLNELNHRVKNTLAIVQSIATQTLRDSADPNVFKTTFNQRLMVLARVHNLLARQSWQGVALGDIATEAAAPFESKDENKRINVAGPKVVIKANAAFTVSMMLHELFTNAAKYGALSDDRGNVAITWSLDGLESGAGPPKIDIEWAESGGPPVSKPVRRGFGTRLIEASAKQLDAALSLDYAPQGFCLRIVLPMTSIENLH